MLIIYTPEDGYVWTTPFQDVPGVKQVFTAYGEMGVYYVLAFGHGTSRHRHEIDLLVRERSVIEEITARGKAITGHMRVPKKFFEQEMCSLAITSANQVSSIPDVAAWAQLKEMEGRHVNNLNKAVWVSDPDKRVAELKVEQETMKLLSGIRKELNDIEGRFQRMTSETGLISLERFML